jgi:hypothetical protein
VTAAVRDLLAGRQYPGRGCVAARTTSGALVVGYFLTGRSQASRARHVRTATGGDLVVADTTGGPADQLRHYTAGARRGGWLVIGNGDQVVPLAEALADGQDVVTAWRAHSYEPDPPIYTPRIWMAWHEDVGPLVGCARRSSRDDGSPERILWAPELTTPGAAVLITTYDGTAARVRVDACAADLITHAHDAPELLDEVWAALDPDLRIAAFTLEPSRPHETLAVNHAVSQAIR